MRTLYQSDLATLPADVCPASLDENLKPITDTTAHRWDETVSPITCAECGSHRYQCPDCFEYDGLHNRESCTE